MAVPGQEQTIFKKVALSEKKMLFREIVKERLLVMVKGAERDEVMRLTAVQTEKDEILLCTADSNEMSKDQKVSANFAFRNERYFFQTDISFQSGWTILKINVDLFQLQRRANARIDLPDNYDGVFALTQHCGNSFQLDCRLKDVSAGGFKMELPGDLPALKVGDQLKGALRLGKRRPMEFEVEVRFAKRFEQDGNVTQIVGAQFLNRGHSIENRLLLLMMDLQRELYLKFSDRS